MQQRQLRLGDILDDYCPRERRVTNHAVVAMIGDDVKQTRCTTCDTEHQYKHARVPRQRKSETPPALYAQVAASAPKRVAHEHESNEQKAGDATASHEESVAHESTASSEPEPELQQPLAASAEAAHPESPASNAAPEPEPLAADQDHESDDEVASEDEGPIHRRLIRASLPRPEGQQPPGRPIPEFTIRQPGGRPNRFRPRHHRGGGQQGQHFQGNRSNGNMGGGMGRGPRPGGGRPGMMKRHGPPGRKRSK
jgi:hypothetical protein